MAFHLVSGSIDTVLLLGLGRNLSIWVTGFLLGEIVEKGVRWLIHVSLNCLQKLSKGIWLPSRQYSVHVLVNVVLGTGTFLFKKMF